MLARSRSPRQTPAENSDDDARPSEGQMLAVDICDVFHTQKTYSSRAVPATSSVGVSDVETVSQASTRHSREKLCCNAAREGDVDTLQGLLDQASASRTEISSYLSRSSKSQNGPQRV